MPGKRYWLVLPLWLLVGCDRADRVIGIRQLRGGHNGLKVEQCLTVPELRFERRLTKQLDAYTRWQAISGRINASDPLLNGRVGGYFTSVGLGLDYFPLGTRWLGGELGTEILAAEYGMEGGYGPVQLAQPDRLWGAGLNLGLTGELPIESTKHYRLIWGAGYNFTQVQAGKADADLNGWYGRLGLEITLP